MSPYRKKFADTRFKIGFRNIKTAVSVGVCLLVFQLLGVSDGIQASITAIICMKSSLQNSLQTGLERVIGTVIGALIGMAALLLLLEAGSIYAVPIAIVSVVIIIYFCNVFKVQNSIIIGLVVFLMILVGEKTQTPLVYGIMRLIETIFGIAAAYLINLLFDPKILPFKKKTRKAPEIRGYRAGDIASIMSLWISSNIRMYPTVNPDFWHDTYEETRAHYLSQDTTLYLYEKGDEVLGFVCIQEGLKLDGPHVRMGHHWESVGTSLIQHVQRLYQSLSAEVPESSENYQGIFLEEGFSVTKESHSAVSDGNILTLEWSSKDN